MHAKHIRTMLSKKLIEIMIQDEDLLLIIREKYNDKFGFEIIMCENGMIAIVGLKK